MKKPKEKANELIEKFKPFSHGHGGELELQNATQCALILCNELIEDNAKNEGIVNGGLNKFYWQEVKENILGNREIDLFDHWEELSPEVMEVLAKYSNIETYKECELFLNELKPLGYIFDYDLNAICYNLRKID